MHTGFRCGNLRGGGEPTGRPERRLEDNIESGLQEIRAGRGLD